MRHARSGKKLGRDSAHRRALYSNLAGALIEHGRIKTTEAKAKAVKPIAEQMITLGRRGDLHARRQALSFLRSQDVVHKLFADVGPRFADRPGGYSRIVKLGPRAGDAAVMVYLELVDFVPEASVAPVATSRTPAAASRRVGRARGARRRAPARLLRPRPPWSVLVVVGALVLEVGEIFFWFWYSRRRNVQVGAETLIGRPGVVITAVPPARPGSRRRRDLGRALRARGRRRQRPSASRAATS